MIINDRFGRGLWIAPNLKEYAKIYVGNTTQLIPSEIYKHFQKKYKTLPEVKVSNGYIIMTLPIEYHYSNWIIEDCHLHYYNSDMNVISLWYFLRNVENKSIFLIQSRKDLNYSEILKVPKHIEEKSKRFTSLYANHIFPSRFKIVV